MLQFKQLYKGSKGGGEMPSNCTILTAGVVNL